MIRMPSTLAWKLIPPLVLAVALIAGGTAWLLHQGVSERLHEQLIARGELVAHSANYASETAMGPAEIQRHIQFLGAETDIIAIALIGHDRRVVAATDPAWRGQPLADLPMAPLVAALDAALAFRSYRHAIRTTADRLVVAEPLLVAHAGLGARLGRGAVAVVLDRRTTLAAMRNDFLWGFAALGGGLITLAAIMLALLHRVVLRPLRRIQKAVPALQTGAGADLPRARDEIGALGAALADAFTRLHDSEDRLRLALENSGLGVWDWNIATGAVTFSPEAETMLGYAPGSWPGHVSAWAEKVHPDDLDQTNADLNRHLDGDSPVYESIHRLRRADGGWAWIRDRGRVVARDAGGAPLRAVGTHADITADRERDAELRRLLDLNRQVLASAAEGIYGVDDQGRTVFVNPAVCQMTGWTEAELLGQDHHAHIHHHHGDGSPYPAGDCPVRQTLADGQSRRVTGEVFWHRDGRAVPVDYATAPITVDGTIRGAVVVVHDISERQAAEQALADKTAALERSNAELQSFAYVASHDLQEPLRMVSSFLTLLVRRHGEKLDDEAREFIDYAVNGAQRMSVLLQDLLTYSRVTTHGAPFAEVDLNQVVAGALANLRVAIDERGGTVTTGENLPTVRGDRSQLLRLVQNLVANALRYHHPDRPPEIAIAAETTPEGVILSVTDNGIGIAPEHFERIFQVFQRVAGRRDDGGTGIGLAVARRIAERHGGTLTVASVPGDGSVFRLFLPAAPPAPTEPAEKGGGA